MTDFALVQKLVDFLRVRRRHYQLTFPNPAQHPVLVDLAKFCHATEVPYGRTDRETYVRIGRLEVWNRIQQHLNLQPSELYALYNASQPPTQGDGR